MRLRDAIDMLAESGVDAHRRTSVRTQASEAENCVKLCKVGSKPPTNTNVYWFTSRFIVWQEVRIAFQACAIDHSAISPFRINNLRPLINALDR